MTNAGAELGSRALFPTLSARVYANHAAISPLSQPVVARMHEAIADYAAEGLGAITPWVRDRELLRCELAEFFGVSANTLGFVQNTSSGVRAVALGVPWKTGDRVLVFDGEFPANVTPWERAAELYKLEILSMPIDRFRVDPGGAWIEFQRHLDRGVRLVAVSVVEFQTGFRVPLSEITRRSHLAGAEVFADAIQAAGAIPLNIGKLDVDYLCGGGRKWMMGAEGGGYLYVHDRCIADLRPVVAGWLSHENPLDFLGAGPGLLRRGRPIRPSTDFVEGGALNVIGYAGLRAALGLIRAIGTRRIFDHIQAWHDLLEPEMIERGFVSMRSERAEGRSGILSFAPPAGHRAADLTAGLLGAGVSAGNPEGLLRFAPHWPNSLNEISGVVAAVDGALSDAESRG